MHRLHTNGGADPLPVAVVIPAYNCDRFIEEAIASIRAQTHQPAEIIVVDDGSTDRSGALARARGAIVHHQENRGPGAARNTAIQATSQPWVAFLDADDVWEPSKLEAQWLALRACPDIGAVITDFVEFDAAGTQRRTFLTSKPHYRAIERSPVAPGILRCDAASFRQQFLKGNFIAPSTMLVRRDLLLQIGLFDPALSHMEDRDCWLRLLTVATVAVVERPLVRVRIHESNLTHDKFRTNVAGILLTERILASPTRYPPGTAEQYRNTQHVWHLGAGRFAEERGDLKTARRYYLQACRLGGGLLPFALAILSCLPLPLRRAVRAMTGRRPSAPPRAHASEGRAAPEPALRAVKTPGPGTPTR